MNWGHARLRLLSLPSVVPNNDLEAMISMPHIGCQSSGTLMTFVEFKRVYLTGHTVKAGLYVPC